MAAYVVGFIALFILSGIGNGSVYKMIPSIFEAKAQSLDGLGPAEKAAWSRRMSGALIGIAGAIGALGGVGINIVLRASYLSAAKSATMAFWVFLALLRGVRGRSPGSPTCARRVRCAAAIEPATAGRPAWRQGPRHDGDADSRSWSSATAWWVTGSSRRCAIATATSRWQITVLCEEPTAGLRPGRAVVVRRQLGPQRARAARKRLRRRRFGRPAPRRAGHRDRPGRTHGHHVQPATVIGYDALVLATGSYPFVPPIPGNDLDRCFVYRTLDDLDAIRAGGRAAEPGRRRRRGRRRAAGPGGRERAAAAGPDAARRGVRAAADAAAGRRGRRRGAGRPRHRARPDRAHRGVDHRDRRPRRRADGRRCPTARPSTLRCWCSPPGCGRATSWPARAGWTIAERGGVVTDIACRTSDPHIYAIGEVAAVEGRCYGLVAPGYATAEVVADRLLGGTAEFPGADMSTKLKLLGVDVASFGDAHATTDGALEVVLNDAAEGHLREARRLRRRVDAAGRHPGRRRQRLRHAAPAGRAVRCPPIRRR